MIADATARSVRRDRGARFSALIRKWCDRIDLVAWVAVADAHFLEPEAGDRWLDIGAAALPVSAVSGWVIEPRCGAAVTFVGTARDHSDGRHDVDRLEYEAYEEQVVQRFDRIVDEMRNRWPEVGRVAMLHRVGEVPVTEAAVVVAVASPHRSEAFAAASFGIDTLKATAPIWKRESWIGGESWGLEPQHILEVHGSEVGGA